MSSLPADIARCEGWRQWSGLIQECRDCARTDISGLDRVVWMLAPVPVDGKCPMKEATDDRRI